MKKTNYRRELQKLDDASKPNPYRDSRRLQKAVLIADVMFQHRIRSDVAEKMDDTQWSLAAAGARVRTPGLETRKMVVERLRRMEAAIGNTLDSFRGF